MSDVDCSPGREPRSVAASLLYIVKIHGNDWFVLRLNIKVWWPGNVPAISLICWHHRQEQTVINSFMSEVLKKVRNSSAVWYWMRTGTQYYQLWELKCQVPLASTKSKATTATTTATQIDRRRGTARTRRSWKLPRASTRSLAPARWPRADRSAENAGDRPSNEPSRCHDAAESPPQTCRHQWTTRT